MTPRRWRLAVVGCGAAAFGIHLPILAASDSFDVVAVADREHERAEAAARRFGVPSVAGDAETALSDADMLVVLTPDHEDLIEIALSAGRHVFTEKPVSLDAGRTRRIITRTEAAGLVLEVGAMRMYDPAVSQLWERMPTAAITGGSFTKFDGADAEQRARHLPDGFEPYTFATPPDDGPYGRALRLLLWSGYHLLTALALGVPDVQVTAGSTDCSGQRLMAILRTTAGAPLTVVIGPGRTDEYHEEVQLRSHGDRVGVTFSPPYGFGAGSRLVPRHRTGLHVPDNPFECMWTAIACRLADQPRRPKSADVALKVEALAARIAVAAAHHGALPEVNRQ